MSTYHELYQEQLDKENSLARIKGQKLSDNLSRRMTRDHMGFAAGRAACDTLTHWFNNYLRHLAKLDLTEAQEGTEWELQPAKNYTSYITSVLSSITGTVDTDGDTKEVSDAKISKAIDDELYNIAQVVAVTVMKGLPNRTWTYQQVLTDVAKSVDNYLGRVTDNHEFSKAYSEMLSYTVGAGIYFIGDSRGGCSKLRVEDSYKDSLTSEVTKAASLVTSHPIMVIRPLDHTDLVSGKGGYLNSHSPLLKRPFTIKKRTKKLTATGKVSKKAGKVQYVEKRAVHPSITKFNSKTQPEFFSAINKYQSTPYNIDKDMLSLINIMFNKGDYFEGYVPENLIDSEIEKGLQKWTDSTKRLYEEINASITRNNLTREEQKGLWEFDEGTIKRYINREHDAILGKKRSIDTVLIDAEEYVKYDNIYFPIFLDFRQRNNVYHTGLSPQGNSFAKALLSFADTKPFCFDTAMKALGNMLGYDKQHNDYKVKVANKWYYKAKNMCSVELVNELYSKWERYDDFVGLLRILIELNRYEAHKDAGETYMSGYIFHQDSRCSGAQIQAALQLDSKAGMLTSLTESYDKNLPDSYMYVADHAKSLCQEDADDVDKDLLDIPVLWKRSTFKTLVMTVQSYGATKHKVLTDNDELFRVEDLQLPSSHKKRFNQYMMDALDGAVESCYNFLNSSKRLTSMEVKAKGRIFYKSHLTGFPVFSKKCKTKDKEVESLITLKGRYDDKPVTKRRTTMVRVFTDEVNTNKTTSSTVPSYIHSVDGAMLIRIIGTTDFNLSLIHDSVGSHLCDADKARQAYNNTLVEVSEQGLSHLYNQLSVDKHNKVIEDKNSRRRTTKPTDLIPIPKVGDLDKEQILNATHSVC